MLLYRQIQKYLSILYLGGFIYEKTIIYYYGADNNAANQSGMVGRTSRETIQDGYRVVKAEMHRHGC